MQLNYIHGYKELPADFTDTSDDDNSDGRDPKRKRLLDGSGKSKDQIDRRR